MQSLDVLRLGRFSEWSRRTILRAPAADMAERPETLAGQWTWVAAPLLSRLGLVLI